MEKFMSSKWLTDSYGRQLKKLRLSLIDACNFRCTYCMPEDAHFYHQKELLSSKEFIEIVSALQTYGVEEVRVTGGEPTLRHDFIEIMQGLSEIPLKKLSLTTNAFALEKHLVELKKTACTSINISMDSINEEQFFKITKSNSLNKVIRAALVARDLGFKVKVNCVMMKGINDNQFEDFIAFSAKENIEVRFLELMKIGVVNNHYENNFLPAREMMKSMKMDSSWKIQTVDKDSTSFRYHLDNGAQIGFIASESMPFCQNCSRLRLDPKGMLRGCLMREEGYSLRGIAPENYPEILTKVTNSKPMDRIESIDRPMYLMGG
jgi:cyclic pyranopterin phosphate synthase